MDNNKDNDHNIILISDEGDRFPVMKSIASMSELVRLLVDTADSADDEITEIPLPNVSTAILNMVIGFCEYASDEKNDQLSDIEKPLKSDNMHDIVPRWYAEFVDVPLPILFQLVACANYMDIKPLLDLSCAKMASIIRGKNSSEIWEIFSAGGSGGSVGAGGDHLSHVLGLG